MTTTIAILEATGLFIAGLAFRAVLVLAVMSALAVPIALLGMAIGRAGDSWRRHFGTHAPAVAHARR
jgi:Na+-transporting methylmalonyl-CoA/oxaloacetate decarboxylase gamma subunit